MMTIERAAEIVSSIRTNDPNDMRAIDLFSHFVDFFKWNRPEDPQTRIQDFARLCGFGIANVDRIDGTKN